MKGKIYFIIVFLCFSVILGGCEEKTTEIALLPISASEPEGVPPANEDWASLPQDESAKEGSESDSALTTEPAANCFVHICGAVKEPGVYELAEGSRIFAAVTAAGGFLESADPEAVNLALPVSDGSRIRIPTMDEAAQVQAAGEETPWLEEMAGSGATGETPGWAENNPAADNNLAAGNMVNLNTASVELLSTLPGIGEAKARSIIAYREQQGKFNRIEDIMQVEGIKEGLFKKMKDRITV